MAPTKRRRRTAPGEKISSEESGNPVLEDETLRREFATAFKTSLLVITEPCVMCTTDLHPVTKKPFADPNKPFSFAAVGILTREGVVDEDEMFVVGTGQLGSVSSKPLVFDMAPGRVS
jgi:hypothetical protein